MNVLWPSMTRESTTLRRLGRVLFWLFLAPAVLMAGLGIFIAITGDGADKGMGLAYCMAFAVPLYAFGRASCYVLAGE